ncbi:hypothetical protein SIID45300_01779 [Candidatus Magnetaquicoccaceae bacterium FCR-1]|uniref:HTH cro/C1-type domain-containing protein n=1 Tax=Candidatus Magnetaquiglobus chichijimensis TaxID=3141448 RepID=A0ABQ0C981_9PROT
MSENIGDRILEERKRLKMNQTDFAAIGGVVLNTQFTYEKNTRIPDATYLASIAAAGVDVNYILTGMRSGECNPRRVAEEVAGVLYVVESILRGEGSDVPPKPKAEMVFTAYLESTPEERRLMLQALEQGVFMIPLSVAKLFQFKTK